MKRKCDKCRGKGGENVTNGYYTYWKSCLECKGRGHLFTGAVHGRSKSKGNNHGCQK